MSFWGNEDFFFHIASGHIDGYRMYSIPGRKNSLSQVILDDLTQIPSALIYDAPGGAVSAEILSDSSADEAASSGARTMDLHFLDGDGIEQQETLIMNGTTPVQTASTNIDFIQWAHVKTIGGTSNETAVGNISIRSTDGATTWEYIAAGGNQSLSGRYKVPSDKIGYVMGWQVTGISQRIDCRLRATVERFDRSLTAGVFLFQDIVVLKDMASGWIPFTVPLKMPSGAEIKMSAISAAAAGDAGGQFDIMLVDENAKFNLRTMKLR